jgi:hypothetical protein
MFARQQAQSTTESIARPPLPLTDIPITTDKIARLQYAYMLTRCGETCVYPRLALTNCWLLRYYKLPTALFWWPTQAASLWWLGVICGVDGGVRRTEDMSGMLPLGVQKLLIQVAAA